MILKGRITNESMNPQVILDKFNYGREHDILSHVWFRINISNKYWDY